MGVSSAEDASKSPPVKQPELRAELIRRAQADQDARGAMTNWMRQFGNQGFADATAFETSLNGIQKAEFKQLRDTLQRTDKENTERLGEIVERHGWPTHSLVGEGGAKAAWLLVQHADASPRFQRKCLDLMAKAPRDQISPQDFAYLTDRVLLAEGKKQIYGSQFTFTDGKWEPRPLIDAANVDQRRAEVGLPPLAEYVKDLESLYGLPSRK
jgi:hypothetical protein